MDTNKKSYDIIAEKWGESRSKLPLNQCVIDFVSKLKKYGNVLDIGCGTGYPIAKYLSEQGFIVTGIDFSDSMIAQAKSLNCPNATFCLCDFFEFLPSEKYDGIIAFDSFFHFPKERQSEIYYRISKWLNKGGYLLFTHGKKDGETSGEMFGEPFYYGALDREAVHTLLIDNGFTIELSEENYKEKCSERDLLIVAKKH